MSVLGSHDEVVYILVSINIYLLKDTDSVHYVCGVLIYNTGSCWRCDDDIINNYSGYTENDYDDISHKN